MNDDANLPAQWAKEDTSHLEATGADGDPNDFSQPFIIYADRRQAIKKLNKRMMVVAPLFILYALFVCSMHLYIVAAIILAQLLLMYLWVVRSFNKNVRPLMQLDASGITIHGLLTHLHMDWDNVKEVRPYTFAYKYVGLDAKNIWKLKASIFLKMFVASTTLTRLLYRCIGIKLSEINVPEQYSHFKAEDICEQIEKRRDHYLGLPNHQMALQAQAEAKLAVPQAEAKLAVPQPESKLAVTQSEATLKLPDAQEKLKVPNSED